ncbi:hypothetical protein [Asanoa siamensis]|uniref:Uncharacterized protein n=1 Tax=Asanoa siamensis TaxID=926357 RepID=A0ABQ4CTV8_9ACTN|nr:hypothetical protein [Asanoa siamensis]GIF74726.1 hypothetical protein Asi02nite_42440 [Asanoa siamensis]
MKADHPSWCASYEPYGVGHRSNAAHASSATDLVDVRLTLLDLAEETGLPIIMIDFLADGEAESHVLPLDQAVLVEQAIRSLINLHEETSASRSR